MFFKKPFSFLSLRSCTYPSGAAPFSFHFYDSLVYNMARALYTRKNLPLDELKTLNKGIRSQRKLPYIIECACFSSHTNSRPAAKGVVHVVGTSSKESVRRRFRDVLPPHAHTDGPKRKEKKTADRVYGDWWRKKSARNVIPSLAPKKMRERNFQKARPSRTSVHKYVHRVYTRARTPNTQYATTYAYSHKIYVRPQRGGDA